MPIRHAATLALLLAPLTALAQEPGPAAARTPWTTIEPGGETSCATGTPYAFHVKPGEGADAAKLLIFLNGGGACWTGEQCDLGTEPTPYVPFVQLPANDPRGQQGVFDLGNPENPVANWTQVYAAYCTGDVHLGNRDATYETADGREVTVRHRGRANVEAVLAWVYENVETPERVVVAGSSAGAIAAPLYAAEVADHYPDVEIAAFADGAGGYRDATIAGLIETWGFWDGAPEWAAGIDHASATFEDIDAAAAKHAPKMRVVEYDSAYDSVQEMFLRLLGNQEPLYPLLQQNRAEQAEAIPGFAGYTSRGTEHTLIRFDRLYTYEEEGVRAVDWFGDVAEGREAESVTCGEPEACGKEPE